MRRTTPSGSTGPRSEPRRTALRTLGAANGPLVGGWAVGPDRGPAGHAHWIREGPDRRRIGLGGRRDREGDVEPDPGGTRAPDDWGQVVLRNRLAHPQTLEGGVVYGDDDHGGRRGTAAQRLDEVERPRLEALQPAEGGGSGHENAQEQARASQLHEPSPASATHDRAGIVAQSTIRPERRVSAAWSAPRTHSR